MNRLEKEREELQQRLDSQKTQKERNRLGQFATPYALARDIMEMMKPMCQGACTSLIEPSMGTGAFYSAFLDVFDRDAGHALGFEVDSHYCVPSKELWRGKDITIRQEDFLKASPDDGQAYDMLVANPPYVRHHHIDSKEKKRLQSLVMSETGIRISGLAGLYCFFMLLSSAWLKKGGLSCWLVPCEFMDVNYGQALKKYLVNNVELLRIHRFSTHDSLFPDALVSSCVVVFRKGKPSGRTVSFTSGASLRFPSVERAVGVERLGCDLKWSGLFEGQNLEWHNGYTLGDFFTIKRGIATGDNDFFILNEETVKEYSIPSRFLHHILPSPRYVGSNVILRGDSGQPLLDKKLYLFSCPLSEEEVETRYPGAWQYIKKGKERGVDKGYICSRRTPWYSCEERRPAPFVVPYMGRGKSAKRMFRFIRNNSDAITTNVYLLLYPNPDYSNCLKNKDVLDEVWAKLNSIPTERIAMGGRAYGGGLHKIEPKELMGIPASQIASVLVPLQSNRQLSLF